MLNPSSFSLKTFACESLKYGAEASFKRVKESASVTIPAVAVVALIAIYMVATANRRATAKLTVKQNGSAGQKNEALMLQLEQKSKEFEALKKKEAKQSENIDELARQMTQLREVNKAEVAKAKKFQTQLEEQAQLSDEKQQALAQREAKLKADLDESHSKAEQLANELEKEQGKLAQYEKHVPLINAQLKKALTTVKANAQTIEALKTQITDLKGKLKAQQAPQPDSK